MDDLTVTLPCGFTVDYKQITQLQNRFICPICLTHQIERQECLNMNRNKLVLNQTDLNLKQKKLSECRQSLEIYRNMPNYFIDDNRATFKFKIDARKEFAKLFLNHKIDQYFQNVIKDYDHKSNLKLKEFKDKIEKINKLEKEVTETKNQENLDFVNKLESINNSCKKIDDLIKMINSAISILSEENFSNYLDLENILKNIFNLKKDENIINSEEENYFRNNFLLEKNVYGKVKSYCNKNGYGSIQRKDKNEVIFFLQSAIMGSCGKDFKKNSLIGERVRFDLINGIYGKQAINITGLFGQTLNLKKNSRRLKKKTIGYKRRVVVKKEPEDFSENCFL